MEKNDAKIITYLFMVIALPIVVVVSTVLYGWVLTILWGWFVMPVFHVLPLSLVQAIGLAITISFLTRTPQRTPTNDDDQLATIIWSLVVLFGYPLFVLLIGWIVQMFI